MRRHNLLAAVAALVIFGVEATSVLAETTENAKAIISADEADRFITETVIKLNTLHARINELGTDFLLQKVDKDYYRQELASLLVEANKEMDSIRLKMLAPFSQMLPSEQRDVFRQLRFDDAHRLNRAAAEMVLATAAYMQSLEAYGDISRLWKDVGSLHMSVSSLEMSDL